jgi:hypothetical protein
VQVKGWGTAFLVLSGLISPAPCGHHIGMPTPGVDLQRFGANRIDDLADQRNPLDGGAVGE